MSLVGYDIFLLSLGYYLPEVVDELETRIREAGFCGKGEVGLRHSDSVDGTRKRALHATRQRRGTSMRHGVQNTGKGKICDELSCDRGSQGEIFEREYSKQE